MSGHLSLALPPEALEAIAVHVAELLAERERPAASAWLDVAEAAAYMRCSKQRVYDLSASGRLRTGKDGSRSLFRREWLDEYLEGER
jgi:excisionase family DNA binding protein